MSQVLITTHSQAEFLAVPPAIELALSQGAALAISLSGGKDSQALLMLLAPWFRQHGYDGQLFAIHADLAIKPLLPSDTQISGGSIQNVGAILKQANAAVAMLTQEPSDFAGFVAMVYCKKALMPINSSSLVALTNSANAPLLFKHLVIVVCGNTVFFHETVFSNLVTHNVFEIRPRLSVSSSARRVTLFAPRRKLALVLSIARRKVYQRLRFAAFCTRFIFHFYVYEWTQIYIKSPVTTYQRLSCALCVLGSKNDLLNGANHNPTTYGLYLELEVIGGSTFKHNQSLFDLPVSGRAAEVREEVLARIGPAE